MLKDIEEELVRYFNIKRRQIKEYYQIPEDDDICLSKIRLNFQSMRHIQYNAISGSLDNYSTTPINFIIVTIGTNYPFIKQAKILINLYIYLNDKATKIDRIETTGGIISGKPTFYELMRYIRFCLGFRREDFKKLLTKLKVLNVSVV